MAKERVKIRVAEGGHNIQEPIIERRYKKSVLNLIDTYMDISKNIYIFNNSKGKPDPIAQKTGESWFSILNDKLYQKLLSQYDKFRTTTRL